MSNLSFDPFDIDLINCSNCLFLVDNECHRYPPVAQYNSLYLKTKLAGKEFSVPVPMHDECLTNTNLIDNLDTYPAAVFPYILDPDIEFCGEWRSEPIKRCKTCASYIHGSCHNGDVFPGDEPTPREPDAGCDEWSLNPELPGRRLS